MRITVLTILLFFTASLQAQSRNAKAQKYFNAAIKEYDMGKSKEALSLLNKAIKKDPNFSNAYAFLAEIYERKNDSVQAIRNHRMAIKTDPVYQYNYYIFSKYLFSLGRYDEAENLLKLFDSVPKMKGFDPKRDAARERTQENVVKLKESCKIAREDTRNIADLHIQNMGPNINTTDWEYWPGMTIDGKFFLFTKMINGQEDFYISTNDNEKWSKAIPLPGKINTLNNEGTTSVSADGRYIFYTVCNQDGFGSCDIYYSIYNAADNSWSRRGNLGKVINTQFWDAQPALSADGRTLIFASARPGGYGGKDLWTSKFANGVWSEPKNLGPAINTSEDDEAPYLHYDGKTLYFASTGHPGFGQHDLFISKRNPDGSWNKPVNMGKGINTTGDDLGMYVDRKGQKAYFVSTREGGFGGPDIYSFELSPEKKPEPVSFVVGNIFDDENRKELPSKIEIVNLLNNEVIFTDSTSYFFTTLEPGKNYALNAYRQGYIFYSANFQPTVASLDSPYTVNAYLKKLKNNETVVLRNIFFDVDKFDLKQESFVELETVVNLLRNNPAIKIEISGHTDNTGSEEHNIVLSENRAKSVQNYLISKGISAKRIIAKGFGSRNNIDDNNTEKGRANNRRIEMRIISVE
ncbi:MAG: PD40 domain-containing protein [Bacteroidetes bacterium]|nr:PD40 domain-containing protein [Bacteroidota bacterium]